MNEQLLMLKSHLRMIWLYRWVAIVVAFLLCLIGWYVVLTMPNQYSVNAKIYIDTSSMLKPLLRGLTVNTGSLQNTAELMKRTLMTRPTLEEVVRRTDLDHSVATPKEFESLITSLSKDVRIAGDSKVNIYNISYTDNDPKLAKRLVEELLNTFMESTLGESRKDSATTQQFLSEQINEYEQKLIASEERLKNYKLTNMHVMSTDGGDYYSRMKAEELKLKEARLQLEEARNRRNEIKRQLEGEEPVFGLMQAPEQAMSSPELTQIESRINTMQDNLDNLLLKYTDRHPDVANLKDTIARLEEERETLEAELMESAPEVAQQQLDSNPVFQELKLSLGRAEAEIAALQTRSKEYSSRVEELKALVDRVPEVESEMKRLNRDYDIIKKQYDELVKRREAANLSEKADKVEDIKMNVIEPPRMPLQPDGPKRLEFIGLVFLAALGTGFALSWVIAQLKPRVFSGYELKELSGLPVLGTVSMVQSKIHRSERRMELIFFSLVLGLLSSVCLALLALQMSGVDLHSHVTALSGRIL